MRKRLISVLLLLSLLISSLSVGVSAATISITFDKTGITSGCYDQAIECSILIGTTQISTLYIKDIDINDTWQIGNLTGENTAANAVVSATGTSVNGSKGRFKKADKQYYTLKDPQLATTAPTTEATLKTVFGEEFFNKNCKSELSNYYFLGFTGSTFTSKYGLLIQITGTLAEVDRSKLDEKIALVWKDGAYTDNYYTENDRYNGSLTIQKDAKNPTKGAWYELTKANGPLETAKGDLTTQNDVDSAYTALETAIEKLIPKTEVNATELYEFLSDYTKTEQGYDVKSQLPLKQADYPAARWQAFEDAMASGHALLDALYETDRETGAVTPSARNWGPNRLDEGKPEDAITNETLASALTTIRTALSGLVNEDDLKSADDARSYIRKLNTMFPAAQQGRYTDASWKKFVAARDKANALLEKYPASTDIPNDAAASEIRTAYSNYYKAAYGLTESGEITVHVTVNDNLGALYPQYALTDSKTATFDADIKLADGQHSLKAALNASPFSWASALKSSNAEKITERRLVYINGVIMQNDATTADITNTDICLRNGDEVTVLRVIEPVGS